MRRFILDAWAVLALLQKEEPAASRVRDLLQAAQEHHVQTFISIINLGEVYYRVGRTKGEAEAQRTVDELRRLRLEIVSATDERVLAAAGFKMHHAVSYADAFAATSADEFSATLVTGDPELVALQNDIQLEEITRQ